MPNLNKVMLMGHLTRDPELKYTQNNNSLCAFGLATSRKWRNQAGEMQEETCFVDLEAWGKTGEAINQYVSKGHPLYVEGRLKLDQWEDKEGNKRSKLKVVVERFEFLKSRDQGQQHRTPDYTRPQAEPQQAEQGPALPMGEDDIPFE